MPRTSRGLGGALILLALLTGYVTRVHADTGPTYYAGWAVEAYPELSSAEMEAMVQRIAGTGATGSVQSTQSVIWIGHNNPGEVSTDKVEPGLSYAVYEAYQDPDDPRYAAAVAMVQAQHRMLDACRAVGVNAVLPVGYQIQMGQGWNDSHPGDARRDAAEQPLDIYGGGISASFYAPGYRRDIEAYYRWVDAEFVRPYADVLMMINLADEPIGGDYSPHAKAEFERRYGFGFSDVGDDPNRQQLLGEFQSRYVVEYANYSARLWQEIHPDLPVTMSFDGSQARKTFTLPDVEALFRDTASNFVVTLDAYPRDGLPHIALSDKDLVGLFLLARSAGLYSARYERPVWLWAAANSWGLSQASPDPGSVSDAVANGIYLALLVRQGGGDLQGVAYWNYNVKEQGLYNDTHATAYDAEAMFAQVSAALPGLRRLMAEPPGQPEVLILAPPAVSHQQIGAAREAIRWEVQPFQRLSALAKEGVNAAVVGSLAARPFGIAQDRPPGGIRAIVILSPEASHVAQDDLSSLRDFLSQGGKVVAPPNVGEILSGTTGSRSRLRFNGLVEQRGNLYIAQRGIAPLFEDQRHEVLSAFWREVLGLRSPQPGYRVVTDRIAFHYHIGPEPAKVRLLLPFEAIGYRYDEQARPVEMIRSSYPMVTLARREYMLLSRVTRQHPWID